MEKEKLTGILERRTLYRGQKNECEAILIKQDGGGLPLQICMTNGDTSALEKLVGKRVQLNGFYGEAGTFAVHVETVSDIKIVPARKKQLRPK